MEIHSVTEDVWGDLVVAMLAVNQFPLEKAEGLLDALRDEKLTDPKLLGKFEPHEIYKKLISAGYDRGDFITYLLAERLSALGGFAEKTGIAHCEKVIHSGDVNQITPLLSPAKGVGPAVLKNFFMLRGIS